MILLIIISTIFIPPTLVGSVHVMNFDPGASFWNIQDLALNTACPAFRVFTIIASDWLVLF